MLFMNNVWNFGNFYNRFITTPMINGHTFLVYCWRMSPILMSINERLSRAICCCCCFTFFLLLFYFVLCFFFRWRLLYFRNRSQHVTNFFSGSCLLAKIKNHRIFAISVAAMSFQMKWEWFKTICFIFIGNTACLVKLQNNYKVL